MSAPPNEVLDLVTRLKAALDERQAMQARRRTIITDWHERKLKVEQAEWNALCQNLVLNEVLVEGLRNALRALNGGAV